MQWGIVGIGGCHSLFRCVVMDLWSSEVNEAEELCFFPVDNRRRGKTSSVDILRAKVDETASDTRRFRFFLDLQCQMWFYFAWYQNVSL